MSEMTKDAFYSSIIDEVNMAKDEETFGWEDQDFFTAVILGYLEDIGEAEDPVICPFRDHGLQMNAYKITEDCDEVYIYASVFNPSDRLQTVSKNDVDAAIKRALQLYRRAKNDLFASFEKDSDTYEFAISIHELNPQIKKLHIVALTNGLVKALDLKAIVLEGVEVDFTVWDIERLHRCIHSGKLRETITIDFQEDFGKTVPCLEKKASSKYSAYLSIISGDLLADIYEKYGPRLLERNVRSFLQAKGAVNKGIRDTLRNEPDMFLAYNNGISATAESVRLTHDENGQLAIAAIDDLQIVNGGQTTASVYNAKRDKSVEVDLSEVFIQMKLSVIKNSEDMDEIVPRISSSANTQNKVQVADFSANDPFHRRIEELSRTIWTPVRGGEKQKNWFYERARGQYADMLSKESTPKRKKEFKETHPLFTKTDLAKYENTWDLLPYVVSEGAQKNFRKFTLRLSERGNYIPDEHYYERLIAKAILFKSAESIIQKQNYGGYRANIVAYTLSLLSYASAQRVDLSRIWKEQQLSEATQQMIREISVPVHDSITNPPGGANISEWCKKSACWERVKEIHIDLSKAFQDELISVAKPSVNSVYSASKQSSSFNAATDDEKKCIEEVEKIPSRTWYALSRWAKETNNFQGWQRSLLFSVGQLLGRGKRPSYKQAKYALEAYKEALQKGFSIQG